jgi:hypothetical protein
VAQAAVADRQGGLLEFVHDGADDACAGEDDVGAFGLRADDRAAGVGVSGAVELDLAVDLGPFSSTAPRTRSGSYWARPRFTAVMLVMAPPIPTSASGVVDCPTG